MASDRPAWWRSRLPVLAIPYGWLLLFFLVPFAIVLKIAFSQSALGVPPYTPLLDWQEGGWLPRLLGNFDNFALLLEDRLYILALFGSIKTALISTGLCLLLGYPMAYAIARAQPAWRYPLLMLVVLPFWTSFLIRVYAWIGLLKDNGLLNSLLLAMGLIDSPLPILYTPLAVYIGVTYGYLPFMVLPLYTILEKQDPSLLEAAADLGAKPWRAFLTVTLPLSLPGVLAGSLLVFIPAMGEYVVPELLGGPNAVMIGRTIWNEFFAARDWPLASAVATVLVVVLLLPIVLFQHSQGRQQQEGR